MKTDTYIAPSRKGKVNLGFWADPETRKYLKMAALEDGVSLQELMDGMIENFKKSRERKQ